MSIEKVHYALFYYLIYYFTNQFWCIFFIENFYEILGWYKMGVQYRIGKI